MKTKHIFTILISLLLSFKAAAFEISIPITEGMLNDKISESFPKEKKKIKFTEPKIFLLQNNAILCLSGEPQLLLLNKKFDFCANFTPKWNTEKHQLEASNLTLVDFDINGVKKVNSVIKTALNQVLPLMDSLILYQTDNWLLKQVSSVEISSGTMYIKF